MYKKIYVLTESKNPRPDKYEFVSTLSHEFKGKNETLGFAPLEHALAWDSEEEAKAVLATQPEWARKKLRVIPAWDLTGDRRLYEDRLIKDLFGQEEEAESVLGQYSRIEKVLLVDEDVRVEAYLLTGDDVEDCFEVDLTGDRFFNEYEVAERNVVALVSNVEGVIDFAKDIGVDLTPHYNGEYLIVGGSNDCEVYSDLTFAWQDETARGCEDKTTNRKAGTDYDEH